MARRARLNKKSDGKILVDEPDASAAANSSACRSPSARAASDMLCEVALRELRVNSREEFKTMFYRVRSTRGSENAAAATGARAS